MARRTNRHRPRRQIADPPQRPAGPFPIDVEDRGNAFVVTADLPGLRTQDLDVVARKNRVRITADFGGDADGVYHRRERERGEVSRLVHLPARVDERHLRASYVDGVLRVTLRKRELPRRVPVE